MPDGHETEVISEPTLHERIEQYQQRIDSLIEHNGFAERTKTKLKEAAEFINEEKYKLIVPTLIAPIIVQQMAEGYPLPEAIVKGLDELMRGDPASHMDPEHAHELVDFLENLQIEDFGRVLAQELIDIGDDYRVAVHEVLVFAGVLKFLEHIRNSKKETTEAIEKGTAKVKPHGEQMFVLGGSASYIADALKEEDVDGVTVIYKDDKGGTSLRSELHEEADSLHSLFLNLGISGENRTYSGAPGWSLLELHKDNLIKTKDGRTILMVVGIDTFNEKEWLDQQEGRPELQGDHNIDPDAHYTSVLELQQKTHSKDENTISVWVGDADRKVIDEETGELSITDKEVALKNGVQIYIDTMSVVVKHIEERLQEDIDRKICTFPCGVRLISDKEEYHDSFDKVADSLSLHRIKKEDDQAEQAILIVYEETSDETLHTAKRRMEQSPGRKIIAVTSNIRAHTNALRQGISSICVAQVLAEEIQTVRNEIKSGKTPKEIQDRLDAAYKLHPPQGHEAISHAQEMEPI